MRLRFVHFSYKSEHHADVHIDLLFHTATHIHPKGSSANSKPTQHNKLSGPTHPNTSLHSSLHVHHDYFSTSDTSLNRDVASSGFSSFTPSFSPCAVRIASVYNSINPLLAF